MICVHLLRPPQKGLLIAIVCYDAACAPGGGGRRGCRQHRHSRRPFHRSVSSSTLLARSAAPTTPPADMPHGSDSRLHGVKVSERGGKKSRSRQQATSSSATTIQANSPMHFRAGRACCSSAAATAVTQVLSGMGASILAA